MRYGSVCSGIEAATVAWHPLGWKSAFFSEIENFPRAVLSHHYPDVPLHGDFTTIGENDYGAIDLLVGGTPCQSFSIAGLRKGLNDDRGNLALEFLFLAKRKKPRWILWENVPGVLSSWSGDQPPSDLQEGEEWQTDETSDFGNFLAGVAECGYGLAYRILDAQYFGVPQRRRRVFVVGYLGDWRPPAAVLFERESLQGDITPCREKGKGTPNSIKTGINAKWPADTAPTLDTKYGDKRGCNNQHTLNQGGGLFVPSYSMITANTGANGLGVSEELAPTLDRNQPCAIATAFKVRGGCEGGGKGYLGSEDAAFTVSTGQDQHLFHQMQVRRLTPIECERLQGFPDNYTKLNDKTPDGPRYKALGNSMAVPVMRWIGERIQMVEDLKLKQWANNAVVGELYAGVSV
jgi:DNA (cytosine-5)-methyltransferase 1